MRALVLGLLAALASNGARADDPMPLKPGHGEDLAYAACNACHTSDYIIMNSTFLTPDGWKAEVMKMRNAFAAPIDDEATAEIIAYLGANYAAPAKP